MYWKLSRKRWVATIKFCLPAITASYTIIALAWITQNSNFCYSQSNMAESRYKLFTSRMVSFYLADVYPVSLGLGIGSVIMMLLTQLAHHGRTIRMEGIIHVIGLFGVFLFPTHPTKPEITQMEMEIPHFVSAATCFVSLVGYIGRIVREVRYTAQNEETLLELDADQMANIRLALKFWTSVFCVNCVGLIIFAFGKCILLYLTLGESMKAGVLEKVNPAHQDHETLHHFLIGEWMAVVSGAVFYAPFALLNGVEMTTCTESGRIKFRRMRTETSPSKLFLRPFQTMNTMIVKKITMVSSGDPGFEKWFKQQTRYTLELEHEEDEEDEEDSSVPVPTPESSSAPADVTPMDVSGQ